MHISAIDDILSDCAYPKSSHEKNEHLQETNSSVAKTGTNNYTCVKRKKILTKLKKLIKLESNSAKAA